MLYHSACNFKVKSYAEFSCYLNHIRYKYNRKVPAGSTHDLKGNSTHENGTKTPLSEEIELKYCKP